MELRRLHDTIGVEVVGRETSMAEIDELRRALDERHLLLVRRGRFAPETQLGFVARFGPIIPERNVWGYVSNVREDGIVPEGALLFHSDFAFTAAPVFAISLHALEMPAGGSATLFADAVGAVAALPADLRARLADRRVLNIYDFTLPNDRPMRVAEADPRSPRHEHPVIGRHPRTGVEVVMANEMHTDCIV